MDWIFEVLNELVVLNSMDWGTVEFESGICGTGGKISPENVRKISKVGNQDFWYGLYGEIKTIKVNEKTRNISLISS